MQFIDYNDFKILQYLFQIRSKKAITDRMRSTLLRKVDNYYERLDELLNQNYLITHDEETALSEKGLQYMENYNSVGQDHIFNDDLDLAILQFLYEFNGKVPLDDFPKIILEHAPQYKNSVSEGYNLMGYIFYNEAAQVKNYVGGDIHFAFLKPSGKAYYESLLAKKQKVESKNEQQEEINRLTLLVLQEQDKSKELKRLLEESNLALNEAQALDIPENSSHRKFNTFWAIITAIAAGIGWAIGFLMSKG